MKVSITKNIIFSIIATVLVLMYIGTVNDNDTFLEQVNEELSESPPAAGGATYYICDTGDDNNDGRSELNPYRSYEKAMDTFNGMFAGGRVLFCRGGIFPVNKAKRISNPNCGASSVCTIADYGNSTAERPIFVATDASVFKFEDGGNADQDGGYEVRNLILKSTSNTRVGVYLFNDVDDLTLDNLHIEGFDIGVQSAGTNTPNAGANSLHERIVLKNSVIINNAEQGWLGGCNDCLIEDNVFENNGYKRDILLHNIYIYSQSKYVANSGITVRGNTLYRSAIVNGKCSAVSLVVHGLVDNLVIENNLIKEDKDKASEYCWGISVDPGYATEEAFHNLTIKNNTLLNVGNIGIGCASCVNATIENNKIIDESNILKAGVKVPVRKEDNVKSNNIRISKNSIVLTQQKGVGVSIGGEHEFIVINNDIRQPKSTIAVNCIERKEANLETDISSNQCNKHNGITLMIRLQVTL